MVKFLIPFLLKIKHFCSKCTKQLTGHFEGVHSSLLMMCFALFDSAGYFVSYPTLNVVLASLEDNVYMFIWTRIYLTNIEQKEKPGLDENEYLVNVINVVQGTWIWFQIDARASCFLDTILEKYNQTANILTHIILSTLMLLVIFL